MLVEVLTAALCIQVATGSVLYPYGTKRGDTSINGVDDDFRQLYLGTRFQILGGNYTSLSINTNGVISFSNSFPWYDPEEFPINSGSTLIAVFWADMDLSYIGKLYYRETTGSRVIIQAQSDIRRKFVSCGRNFNPSSAVVVTWKNVDYFHELDTRSCLYQDPIPDGCTRTRRRSLPQPQVSARRHRRSSKSRNTLQVVILTNSVDTFVVFNYRRINWVSGDFSSGIHGMGGHTATVGFNRYDGTKWYNHPESGKNSATRLSRQSNIGINGRWVYRLHGSDIYDPNCVKLT